MNVSGAAGITGNDQDPADWGPPALNFSQGFAALSDGNSAFNRNRTDSLTASTLIYHGKHNITVGGEFRKQEYNEFFAAESARRVRVYRRGDAGPRAAGPASGSDLADFLIGIPDTSSIAFGNADKYFREPVYSLYFNDDWRVLPILTINAGARWDYGAPMTELFGRLVNLDAANGFTAVAPVLGSDPVGPVTGEHYPSSLHAARSHAWFEPRIGISWRPIPASTVVIRAGYGIYPDTSVYQSIVLQLAQQAPLSKSLNAQNSAACPLTLANGFNPCSAVTSDVSASIRISASAMRRPGNWPCSATALCAADDGDLSGHEGHARPAGDSAQQLSAGRGQSVSRVARRDLSTRPRAATRFAMPGSLQLRRRLRSGFAASLTYTYAKSIDDDAYLGGQGHTIGKRRRQTQSANLTRHRPPSRRTGSIRGPNARSRPSINANC